jgi:hypothetical protein
VIANSDKPPYKFQLVPGGIFDVHARFGVISVDKLSLVAIVLISSAVAVTGRVIGALTKSSLVCAGAAAAGLVGVALIGGAAVIGAGMPTGATVATGIFSGLAAISASTVHVGRLPLLPDCDFKVLVMVKKIEYECTCYAVNFAVVQAGSFPEGRQEMTNSLGELVHTDYFRSNYKAPVMIEITDIQETSPESIPESSSENIPSSPESSSGWKIIIFSRPTKISKEAVTSYTQSTRTIGSSSSWPQPPHVCIRLQPDPKNKSFKESIIFKCKLKLGTEKEGEIQLPLLYSKLTQNPMPRSAYSVGAEGISNDDRFKLINELARINHKWQEIGIALEIDNNILRNIRQSGLSDIIKLSEVLTSWINNNTEQDFNWEYVAVMLEGPMVEERGLANEIRRNIQL